MALAEVSCSGGAVSLWEDKILLKKKGAWGGTTDVDIPLSAISSIEMKDAGIVAGYLRFKTAGGGSLGSFEAEAALTFGGVGNVYTAHADRYAIVWSASWLGGKSTNDQMRKFKEMVELQVEKVRNRSQVSNTSGLNDLEKLAELRDKGIITEVEFLAKKKQILGLA